MVCGSWWRRGRNGRSLPSLAALAFGAGACTSTAEELPPRGEAVIVVDTDAPVPSLAARLRVDFFAEGGEWFDSRDIAVRSPSDWPGSFSVFLPDGQPAQKVLIRIRAYPEKRLRDYQGERFAPRPELVQPGRAVVIPPGNGEPRLVRDGVDETPPTEPLPLLTIDRLVRVALEPGARGSVPVVLRGACVGTMADLAGEETCVDEENVRAPVEDEPITEGIAAPEPSRLLGDFVPRVGCEGTPRPPGLASDGSPLYDEEVCVESGLVVLGNPAVVYQLSSEETAGSVPALLNAVPERVALVPPQLVDRYEVTVARWRAAVAQGFTEGAGATVNDGPLGTSLDQAFETFCTYSSEPRGREAFPMNCVTRDAALAFCRWLGSDLPTEAAWEYLAAASGRPSETPYAWGAEAPTCEHAIYGRANAEQYGSPECLDRGFGLAPVSDYQDRTPGAGVVGLGGGVSEWVLDSARSYASVCWAAASLVSPGCFEERPARFAHRGGAWVNGSRDMIVASRYSAVDGVGYSVGFRCARRALP